MHLTREELLTSLLRLERALGGASLKDSLRACLDTALQISGLDAGGVYVADDRSGRLELAVQTGLGRGFTDHASSYPAGSPHEQLLQAGQPVYTTFLETGLPDRPTLAKEGLQALAIVPVMRQGRLVGSLNVASHTLREVPEDVRLPLETVAQKMAAALARSHTRHALRQERANLRMLFSCAQDYLVVMDQRSRILAMNRRMAAGLEYREGELIGQDVLTLHPADRRREAAAILAEIAAGRRDSCGIPLISKSGRIIPVETQVVKGTWNGQDALFGIARDIRERRLAEAALQESRETLHTLFETMTQGVVLQDARGRIVDANPAAQDILGLGLDQMQGRRSMDPRWRAVHEDGSAFSGKDHPAMVTLATGKEQRNVVMGILHPRSEEMRWISITSLPRFRSGEKRPAGVYTIFDDITERRQTESERAMLLEVLSLVNSPASPDELLQQVSGRLREWSGCAAVGIRLRQGPDFPYAQAAGFPERFVESGNFLCSSGEDGGAARAETGGPALDCLCGMVLSGCCDASLPVFTSHGSFWTNRSSRLGEWGDRLPLLGPVRGLCLRHGFESMALIPLRAMGEIHGLLQFCDPQPDRFDPRRIALFERLASDLSLGLAQRATRASLQRSEAAYRLLVENASEAIYVVAGEAIRFANPMCAALSGYSAEELLGRPFGQLVYPEDLPAVLALQRLRLDEERIGGADQFRIVARDGTVRWVEQNSVAITWQGLSATLNFLRDITGRKRMEEQLAQAQKMESVGRLAGGVAHDFNNLLTVINGYSAVLLAGTLPGDRVHEQLSEIRRAGERAAQLTQQLLAFSRRQVLQPRVLNLNDIVADMQRMVERLIGEDIQLITHLDPTLAFTEADPGQINQVVLNLAVNARDAMPLGGRLRLETCNVRLDSGAPGGDPAIEPGDYVLLTVSDTGLGMDEETRRSLFEPFFTTKSTGTGLGLSTVYGIVKQSGGHILVDSVLGRGSTFRIYLPQTRACQRASPADQQPARPDQGSETVLLVEDQADVRTLAAVMLASFGYRVLQAGGGEAALAVSRAHPGPIHLLLTDVVMPGMNGVALSSALRPERPEMRVLFMSGYSDQVIRPEPGPPDGTAFLTKPFDPHDLAAKVREVLGPAPSGR